MTEPTLTPMEQVANWSRSIRSLARQTGVEANIHAYVKGPYFGDTKRIAWIGASNVGKSALLNALVEGLELPVSSLPSNLSILVDSIHAGQGEEALLEGGGNTIVHVYTRDPWIAACNLAIQENSALDASDDDLLNAIDLALVGIDLVVLIIDALTPLRRSEVSFLSVCSRRGLPLVAVCSKSDLLGSEERGPHEAYLRKHLELYAPTAPFHEVCIAPSGSAGVFELKEELDHLLNTLDFVAIRFRQASIACLQALQYVMTAAIAKSELQQQSKKMLEAEHRRRQLATDELATSWPELELELEQRRHGFDEELQSALRLRKASFVEGLTHGLEGRSDVKTWWESELPFRLKNELQAVADSFSVRASSRIGRDLEWLQHEMVSRFRLPPALLGVNTAVTLDPVAPSSREVSLHSANRLSILSRVGQAAGVVVGGHLFFSAGLFYATAGFSILVGIAAEQLLRLESKKDRVKVQDLLEIVVDRTFAAYAHNISDGLRAGYAEITSTLKQHQRNWQQAQSSSLEAAVRADSPEVLDWNNVVCEIEGLRQQIDSRVSV